MGVHRSAWVGLKSFFNPTHHGGIKKNSIQPNPTQPMWIGLGRVGVGPMGWIIFFLITIIIIIIKSSIRKTPLQIRTNL